MIIKKKEGTYNVYALEVSFGELTTLHGALADAEPSAQVDELKSAIDWYVDNVPGPGEDKEEFKQKKELEKEPINPDVPALDSEKGDEPKVNNGDVSVKTFKVPDVDQDLEEPPKE